jgi:aminoglycoside phosphotransferase (APT) family kinase protein
VSWRNLQLSAAPQRVHGDVHGGNILADGREVTGIIDCGHLPLAPRGYYMGYYLAFAVHWWLAGDQYSRPVGESRHVLTGFREFDLVEESWLRTAHWIGDNFDALRLPASASGGEREVTGSWWLTG